MPEKPTPEYILDLAKRHEDLWAEAHAHWQVIDSYYNRTFALWPEGALNDLRTPYHPSTPTNIIDHAVDIQLAFDPKPHRPPASKAETSQEYADLIERWITAAFNHVALLEPVLTWKQIGKHLITYGYTVVEGPVLDLSDVPEEPKRQRGETATKWEGRQTRYEIEARRHFPLRVRAPHPARVLLDPTKKMPREAIKRVRQFAGKLAEMTKKKRRNRQIELVYEAGDNYFEPVDTTEYWTRDYHAVFASGDLLWIDVNTWGYVPFAHAFAGWGLEPTNEDEINPRNLAVGILDPILDSIKVQAQAATGRHNALMEAAYAQRATTRDPSEVTQQLNTSDILQLKPGELWWMDVPNLPAWMFQSEQGLDQDIERGSFARALTGIREPGVSTVGQQAILSTAANRKFAAPLRQLELLATVVARNMLRLVDVLGKSMELDGVTLTPKEIQHDYAVDMKLQVIDPVLSLQERQLGLQELAAGVLSIESYWSRANLEDASGERKRMLKDLVRSEPRVQALGADEVLREMGIFYELERWEAMQAEAERRKNSLLGPDGQPLSRTMGSDMGIGAGGDRLRQPLNGATVKPGQAMMPPGGI